MDRLTASVCCTRFCPLPQLPPTPAEPAVLDLKLWRPLWSPGEPVKTTAIIIQLPGPAPETWIQRAWVIAGNLKVSCHRRWGPGLDLRNSALKSWRPPLLPGLTPRDTLRTCLLRGPSSMEPSSSLSFRTQPPPPSSGSLCRSSPAPPSRSGGSSGHPQPLIVS